MKESGVNLNSEQKRKNFNPSSFLFKKVSYLCAYDKHSTNNRIRIRRDNNGLHRVDYTRIHFFKK